MVCTSFFNLIDHPCKTYRASKDGRIEKFFDLLVPIWFDRFPVKLLDNFDADEGWDGANPDRVEWAKGIQTRLLYKKLPWMAGCHGHNWHKYPDWEQYLTLDSNHLRRRHEYFDAARNNVYLQGDEFLEHVVTTEECEAIQRIQAEALLEEEQDFKADFDSYIAPAPHPTVPPVKVTQCHNVYEPTATGFSTRQTFISVPVTTAPNSQPPVHLEILWNHTSDMQVPEDDCKVFSFERLDLSHPDHKLGSTDDQALVKRRQTLAMDHPLFLWTEHIDLYLQELLRMEGPADQPLSCNRCAKEHSSKSLLFRCSDCTKTILFCSDCMIIDHRLRPLRQIKQWNGTYFEATTLQQLGLIVQVGHLHSENCPMPFKVPDFTVLDVNGIHHIHLQFCTCPEAMPRHVQLLHYRLFPATTIYPQTAATFNILHYFQLLSFMSKVSANKFYYTLVRLTDNTGNTDLPDRYPQFLRMIRQWWHLKMLKHAGRGHDPSGVKGTLKHLKTLSYSNDPGLNHGYAYFVEDRGFKAYLRQYGERVKDEDDPHNCNNHDAIKSASIRGGKGLDTSGTGKTECAQHDMKRPVSVGDLQKGKRYVNMDFFFLSSMRPNPPKKVVVLVGRTDGEAPKRGWAAVNAVTSSTKEMGPGSRHDTLDDHFGD
ncbi:hypothetical protein H0H81_010420 [Sphagnurus paluster]|uniref:CxC2-like cysteine cluster KDZ transposase-associated domain-containing protein n=1 Tax=Sphagnurus paluster TaxID=117069 RepID=A0A9P7FVP7_9AGAR|nr:hypothetical protein H0H81_010420 [Sphagnurus paluster]